MQIKTIEIASGPMTTVAVMTDGDKLLIWVCDQVREAPSEATRYHIAPDHTTLVMIESGDLVGNVLDTDRRKDDG